MTVPGPAGNQRHDVTIIESVDCWIVRVPLQAEWASSPEFGYNLGHDNRVLLRVRDAAGFEGWGEAVLAAAPESIEKTLAALPGRSAGRMRLACLDLGPESSLYWHSPLPPSPYTPNLANLQYRIQHPLQVLIEMAVSDVNARRAGVPLYQWWGGAWRDRVKVDYWMGRVTPEHGQKCVRRARELGFAGVKLKTTLQDPNVERLEAIKDACGADWHVTVDANGRFYRLDDGLPTLRAMDRVGNMTIIEDPFPRFDFEDFARLRTRLEARVVVHLDPPQSIWAVLKAGAAGGLNIDSARGLYYWRLLAATAESANLAIWLGSGLDMGIYTAAQLHLAASAANCQLPGDQAGPWLRESHLLKNDFVLEDGCVLVPQEPGLGVEVDLDAVERYTQRHWNWTI